MTALTPERIAELLHVERFQCGGPGDPGCGHEWPWIAPKSTCSRLEHRDAHMVAVRALLEEVERLRKERDELAKYADACSDASGIYARLAVEYRADNERLRAALREIAALSHTLDEAEDLARAALGGEREGKQCPE